MDKQFFEFLWNQNWPPHQLEFQINQPDIFDGTGSRTHDFITQCQSYLRLNVHIYTTGTAKILFVLSYLKGGAAKYKQNWLDNNRTANGINTNETYEEFMKDLDKAFAPVNQREDAQKRLERLTQGQQTAAKFFQEFEIEHCAAGYNNPSFDVYLISLLKEALQFPTVSKIIGQLAFRPEKDHTYDNWKQLALVLDKADQQLRELSRKELAKKPLVPMCRPPPPPPNRTINPRGDVKDNTGVRFGGRGEPMDLSYQRAKRQNLCFSCGKAGHIAAKCPERKELVRMMIRRMSKEERRDWAEEFAGLRESDFMIEGDPEEEEEEESTLEGFQDDLE